MEEFSNILQRQANAPTIGANTGTHAALNVS
jgi:hypothetical protein